MSSVPSILRVLSSSICVSYKAGSIIRNVFKKGELGIVDKGKNDLQTEADRSAQRCIIGSLRHRFPLLRVFGEEGESEKCPPEELELGDLDHVLALSCPTELKDAKEDEIIVWVDPLDGTSEYTIGMVECVTVLIGIVYKGRPVAGVIYQPFYDNKDKGQGRAVWGCIGLGVYGHNPSSVTAGARILATTRSHCDEIVQACLDACEPTEILRVGGAGNKVILILEGKASAYIYASSGLKKWDTCAPEAVITAAGGWLSDIYGRPIPYGEGVPSRNFTGCLAAFSERDFYVSRVPQICKDALLPRD